MPGSSKPMDDRRGAPPAPPGAMPPRPPGRLGEWLRRIATAMGFRPVHIGHYVRLLHFRRHLGRLPSRGFRRILDAGCGSGDYARELALRFPRATVTAIDLRLPEPSHAFPANLSLVQGDLRDLDRRDEFDFICSIDVLEHIPGNRQVIANLHRALAPGGHLYLHVPDDRQPRRFFPRKWLREFERWADHEHRGEQYTLAEMVELLAETGFTVSHARHTFGLLGGLAWELDRASDGRRLLKIALMPLLKTMARLSVHCRSRHGSLLVVARK